MTLNKLFARTVTSPFARSARPVQPTWEECLRTYEECQAEAARCQADMDVCEPEREACRDEYEVRALACRAGDIDALRDLLRLRARLQQLTAEFQERCRRFNDAVQAYRAAEAKLNSWDGQQVGC